MMLPSLITTTEHDSARAHTRFWLVLDPIHGKLAAERSFLDKAHIRGARFDTTPEDVTEGPVSTLSRTKSREEELEYEEYSAIKLCGSEMASEFWQSLRLVGRPN